MALRLRRGTDAERLTITPLQAELIYTTDTKKLYVGDGATQGGVLVGPVDVTAFDLVNDTSPQLGGDLDLNGNNITGTGNINIDGTITATGNIGLGDADSDTITVSGVINSHLRPALDSSFTLGTQSRRWQNIFTAGLDVDQTLTAQNIVINDTILNGNDSSIVYNADTDTLTATTMIGNLTGSVFSDDSGAVLVDAVAGLVTGNVVNQTIDTNTITIDGPLGGIDIRTEGTQVDNYSLFTISSYHDSSNSSALIYLHGRGDLTTPAAIQAGDTIIDALHVGISSNGTPAPAVQVNTSVDPNGTVGAGIVPGQFTVVTFDDSGSAVTGLSIDRNGALTVADNTASAGVASGEVDTSSVATYLKITVDGTEYAMPLYAINP